MKAHTLMYHDITRPSEWDSSGFPGADAALYKLDCEQFERHLKAIAAATAAPPISATDLSQRVFNTTPFLLTFDDGGRSAYTHTAQSLEVLGWRGHFFVTANQIDSTSFLTSHQIRELHQRGHTIGSHSCSHPVQMSQCSRSQLLEEWQKSTAILSDVIGDRVRVASVPGGHYSRKVAETAAQAGIEFLFTSEPSGSSRVVEGCLVLGRYTVQRWMTAKTAAALATGKIGPRLRQLVLWNLKKGTKAIGGQYYLKVRKTLIGHGARAAGD